MERTGSEGGRRDEQEEGRREGIDGLIRCGEGYRAASRVLLRRRPRRHDRGAGDGQDQEEQR
eukprot:750318-Hanusia_phi.AAC.3